MRVREERVTRTAAQNGLTPYVYALQAFALWLDQAPEADRQMVIEKMSELGIWGVRVGYDPQKDLALSIIGGNRYRRSPS